MTQNIVYNTGNLAKYQTLNPLKKKLVDRFDMRLLQLLEYAADNFCDVTKHSLRLLDAGCGEGFVTAQIKNRLPDCDVIGVDGATEAIDFARENYTSIIFQEGNLYKLNFPDYTFDIVICSEVLEHLRCPEDAVKELKRVSKTVLLLTVPEEPWFRLGNFLTFHNVLRLGDPVDHVNHWSYAGFKRFTKKQLKDFACEYEKSFPWSICFATRKDLRK